jgi:hypothetical protein
MRRRFICHPDFPSLAVSAIEVELVRRAGALLFRYEVTGRIEDLLWPAPAPPERADGLWKHICFEAFLRDASGEGYYELNFSPSGQWAAYRFDGYRSGMRDADIEAPRIVTRIEQDRWRLEAEATLPADASGPLGLSAVIEDRKGAKSYWALAHPPGKPDFHHPDCLVLDLPPAG